MSKAAYDRGSAVVRRHIQDAHPERPKEFEIADRLTAMRGDINLFGDGTVVRLNPDDTWWLMNRPDKGWGEFGFGPFDRLEDVARKYNLLWDAPDTDKHGYHWRVMPHPDRRETCKRG